MGDAVLTVEGLSVRYGAVTAVRDVSLVVQPSEMVAVVGSNGAGKTSLLTGISSGGPTTMAVSGRITIDGRSVERLAPETRVRLGLAHVPQGRRIFTRLSVRENLLVGAVTVSKSAREENLDRVHSLFPVLADFTERTAGLLSGGQQQQLAIGRAMMSSPKVMLLDEPSLGLAPMVVAQLLEALRTLTASGMSVVLVEQNALRAVRLADRSCTMTKGVLEPITHDADAQVRRAFKMKKRSHE
jgi:branched-chain amino acid transport system ATP-binding protein